MIKNIEINTELIPNLQDMAKVGKHKVKNYLELQVEAMLTNRTGYTDLLDQYQRTAQKLREIQNGK